MTKYTEQTVWLKDLDRVLVKTDRAANYYKLILEQVGALADISPAELADYERWNSEHHEVFETLAFIHEIDSEAQYRYDEIYSNFINDVYPYEVEILALLTMHKTAYEVMLEKLDILFKQGADPDKIEEVMRLYRVISYEEDEGAT